jgi:hypothetical protein
MILFGFGDNDPNLILPYPGLIPDEEGNLRVIFVSNLVSPRNPGTYQYAFLLISREGVKSINRNPIGKD